MSAGLLLRNVHMQMRVMNNAAFCAAADEGRLL